MNGRPATRLRRPPGCLTRAFQAGLYAVVLLILLFSARPGPAGAQQAQPFPQNSPPAVDVQWGGHLRAIGTVSFPDAQSIDQFSNTDTAYDGQADLRLKNQLFFGSRWVLDTHYELVALAGDTIERRNALRRILPAAQADIWAGSPTIQDDRRLFSLTHILTEEDRYVVYHRLDRLNLTYTPAWGMVRIGRQALTWGNGLLFNPMDLFNPFAPTTIQRDYKVGDDMALLRAAVGQGDLQLLYVPRRDPQTGQVDDRQASYAAKWHLPAGSQEMDLMAARHYQDDVLAMGLTGDLGNAAWRFNAVYTRLEDNTRRDGFLQAVANLDYAWDWGGRNVYGFMELYYNELGATGDYAQTLDDPQIRQRLDRGELFSLGRLYWAGQVQIELHPLVHTYWTAIVNLSDPSGILQPQLLWDMTENTQMIAGANLYWGAGRTEYGGFDTTVAGTTVKVVPADQIYLWLTYHF